MVINIFLMLIIVFAILSIQSNSLRRAVIYLGILSLVSSFCYLLYGSPDVAIAQAVIGSTLSTILYLVALKKYKLFTIYYVLQNTDTEELDSDNTERKVIDIIESFCFERELEPDVVHTSENLENIEAHYQYDVIVLQKERGICLYGNKENYLLDSLQKHLVKKLGNKLNVSYVQNTV
ncbi:UNVERIFIED_CONTAM: putative MnhB-related membrane protein [Acetivibrio alkalicellulosi]